MEIIKFLVEQLNLDPFLILLVLLSGFFQERFLKPFTWASDQKYDAVLKTFVVSLVFSIIYIRLVYMEIQDDTVRLPWAKYFLSYVTATSLYEMAIRPFRKWWQKKFGEEKPC